MKQLFITSVKNFTTNEPGRVEMKEVPCPEPKADEVRIKVCYASICGSDAHTLTGHLGVFEKMTKAMLPMPFGHEVSGIIDQLGPEAEALGYAIGDPVVVNYAKYCYACDFCRSGRENLCPNIKFCMNGFAEYACYHVSQVFKIPTSYDLPTAALIEPLTVALAVAEQAGFAYGKSVAIWGAGGIGLMLVQLARLAGASQVVVFDPIQGKRELAIELGADRAYDPTQPEVFKENAAIPSELFDCVVEGSGSMAAAEQALLFLSRDGNGVFYAMYAKEPYLSVDLHQDFYWNQKHLHGVIMGAGLFPKAIKLAPRLNLAKIAEKIYPLSRYEEAFEALYSKAFAKVVIQMNA